MPGNRPTLQALRPLCGRLELDVVRDEAKCYFEPRPWHATLPQYPRTWEADAIAANSWGPMNPGMLDH